MQQLTLEMYMSSLDDSGSSGDFLPLNERYRLGEWIVDGGRQYRIRTVRETYLVAVHVDGTTIVKDAYCI